MILKKYSLLNPFDQMDYKPSWKNLPLQVALIIFLTSNGLLTKAQTGDIVINGRVVDAVDQHAITYAHVFIENHDHIGVVTDEKGAFTLKLPGFIEDDYLVISALGFTTKKISLNAVRYSAPEIFELDRMAILLNDVVVTADRYDLEWICQEAVRRIPKNYPDKVHYIKGFYRKVSTDSTQYTGLVEAVIGIKDPGYNKASEKVQIKVYETRSGDNYLKFDTLAMKIGNKISQEFGVSSFKNLHRVYEDNSIRLYKEPHTVFNQQGITFSFSKGKHGITEKAELKDITNDQGDTILHIVVKSYAEEKLLDAIHLSINLNDFAIVEYTRGSFDFRITVKFARHVNGKYYPYMIQRVTATLNESNRSTAYHDIVTFHADYIETTPKKIPKIKQGEDRIVDFKPEEFAYDSLFWQQYFNDHPLYMDMDDDVERSRPLEKQFKNKTGKSK